MKKEKVQQKGAADFVEGSIVGPTTPFVQNLDAINVDNPNKTPQEFTEGNFDALIKIYKLLNSTRDEARLRIEYGETKDGKKTATVFVDNQQHYFTDSIKEIENFHSWSEHKQERKEARNKKSN